MPIPPWRRAPSSPPMLVPQQLADPSPAPAGGDRVPVPPGTPLTAAAATPARDDVWLIGSAFRRYQQAHGLTEQQLAARLGIPAEKLGWLQMRTRPNPAAPTYAADIERLASAFRCDPDVLRRILA